MIFRHKQCFLTAPQSGFVHMALMRKKAHTRKEKLLKPGMGLVWQWARNGAKASDICIHVYKHLVTRKYRTRQRSGEWEGKEYPVAWNARLATFVGIDLGSSAHAAGGAWLSSLAEVSPLAAIVTIWPMTVNVK